MKDGSQVYFKQLLLNNDSVYYQDYYYLKTGRTALQDISQITKTGSYAGTGALSGGALGLLIGIGTAHMFNSTGDFLSDAFTLGKEPEANTRVEETVIIIISAAIGTGLGALAGSLISKNKIVFPKFTNSIIFSPSLNVGKTSAPEFGFTCAINFH